MKKLEISYDFSGSVVRKSCLLLSTHGGALKAFSHHGHQSPVDVALVIDIICLAFSRVSQMFA